MNDLDNSIPESGDDPSFEELIARLKSVEPPLEARIANRVAVAAELSALSVVNQRRQLPWWRRSISIPLPIAASLAVVTALALSSSFRGWQEGPPMPIEAPNRFVHGDANARGEKKGIATRRPNGRPVLRHYESETYLCGVGRVSSESRYSIKE